MKDCIFCKIAAGQIGANVVFQNESVFAFRDVNPQAPIHVLVIPKKHIESVSALRDDDRLLVGDLHKAIQIVARQENIVETGFRVVTNDGANAGQTVKHLHYHVLGGRTMAWPPG